MEKSWLKDTEEETEEEKKNEEELAFERAIRGAEEYFPLNQEEEVDDGKGKQPPPKKKPPHQQPVGVSQKKKNALLLTVMGPLGNVPAYFDLPAPRRQLFVQRDDGTLQADRPPPRPRFAERL